MLYLTKTKLSYGLLVLMAFLFCCMHVQAQQNLRGKVIDSLGKAIAGASVKDRASKITTVTKEDGSFTLPGGKKTTLEISYVGYAAKEVAVNGQSDVVITLSNSGTALNEVVVTALGVKREKRNLTYSTQQLSGDEILKAKEPNLVNAVAGKISGVQVTSSSGNAGASARIVIRGNSSATGDNQALFVVDGIPINNDETGSAGGAAPGAGMNRVVDIDPNTIESINVLKGAAATALYGSSGAKGVVLITTKSGAADRKPVITVSSDLSFEKPLLPERQTAYSQGTTGIFYDGETQKTSASWGARMDTLKINGKPAPQYDPYDFFRTGITSNSTVSAAGGNGNSAYYLSYSFYDQKGIMPGNDFKRHSFFAKYNSKIGKYVNTVFQLGYSNSNQNRLPEGASNGPLFVVLDQPVSWNPYPVLDSNGNARMYRYSRNSPLWSVDNMNNNDVVNRYLPVFTLNVTPASWLTITERIGADMYSEQNKYFENPQPAIGLNGKVIDNNSNFRQFNNDIMINAFQHWGKFDANLLVGNNILSTYYQNTNLTGNGLTVEEFYNVSAGSNIASSESHSLQRKIGFYAQANVEYNKLINLSLTGRYDGSSVLAKGNNFYPYGSVAASFMFSELLNTNVKNVLSFGKLRLSAATVGNDGVGPYSLNTPFIQAGRNTNAGYFLYPYQGQPGFLQSSVLGNPNLQNERLEEYEGGLELKFLKNRISFEGSYFYRKSHNGIIPGVSISNATGFSGTTVNSASIENKGLELLLSATAIRSKDFSWDITFNFTKIKNKVLALYPGIDQLGRIIVGQPYNVFYGVKYKRTADGQLLIDANGLPVVGDQGVVGNATPDWLAGLENTFRYKQFALSFFFDMKKGGDVQNDVDSYGFFYGTAKATADRNPIVVKGISEVDNKPNTVAVNAQTYWQSRQYESTIQDGTYLKLRNVALTYNVNPKALAHSWVKGVSLTASGRNLWIYSPHFTGADPEVSSYGNNNSAQAIYAFSTPTSRSFLFSVKLNF
ncbi:SusC/RagA family TonB-linked outer membrane protein [Pinibacter aurantiacus]|uniref:SusC/RagA family TonB-linked outer membrane protein n=1 Tax=Pinibacter aurantiacus TaxID=2851599 RepID=A0A9E2S7C6_9BACT|nr:SusC/RagA family TonB-linked outer membrane protein [Pinibacter aurantiacus]MBV4357546.1 SusC/RagA family TonB-linked outer membrane protein [Pinibacter aurantiacus]